MNLIEDFNKKNVDQHYMLYPVKQRTYTVEKIRNGGSYLNVIHLYMTDKNNCQVYPPLLEFDAEDISILEKFKYKSELMEDIMHVQNNFENISWDEMDLVKVPIFGTL